MLLSAHFTHLSALGMSFEVERHVSGYNQEATAYKSLRFDCIIRMARRLFQWDSIHSALKMLHVIWSVKSCKWSQSGSNCIKIFANSHNTKVEYSISNKVYALSILKHVSDNGFIIYIYIHIYIHIYIWVKWYHFNGIPYTRTWKCCMSFEV